MGLGRFKIWFLLMVFAAVQAKSQVEKNVREEVFLHLNSNDLVVGQTIYFSAFVYGSESGKLSRLSKILYVELINSSGLPVQQQKIKIEEGLGSGSFFIPSLLSSGVYKMVAYTKWMKNWNAKFAQPVVVINPFEDWVEPDSVRFSKEIGFFPEGGNFIPNSNNRVVVKLPEEIRSVNQGRLLRNGSEEVLQFDISSDGYTEFDLSMDPGNYQLVFELENEFKFYDLPQACTTCVSVRVDDTEDSWSITLQGTPSKSYKLEITSPDNMYYSSDIQSGIGIMLDKWTFPYGIFYLKVLDGADIVSERLLSNQSIGRARSTFIANRNDSTSVSFELPSGSIASVSISKLSDSKPGSIEQSRVASRLDDNILTDFMDLDRVLLLSGTSKFQSSLETVKYLPEYRSDLMTGKTGSTSEFLAMTFSIPGRDYHVQVSEIDNEGSFLLDFDAEGEKKAYLQTIPDTVRSEVTVENEFYETHEPFYYPMPQMDSSRVSIVVDRSINAQLENAYYVGEEIGELTGKTPQIEGFITYFLDDYTRFPTIRDTFLEFVPEIAISKNETRMDFALRLLDSRPGSYYENLETLLLVDGRRVNMEQMLSVSPFLVERIDVLNRKYYFGSTAVNGIVSFSTFDGDARLDLTQNTEINLKGLETTTTEIPAPEDDPRIPDRRENLLWIASQKIDESGELTVDFKTSNIAGDFLILVNGITEEGVAFTRSRKLTVR